MRTIVGILLFCVFMGSGHIKAQVLIEPVNLNDTIILQEAVKEKDIDLNGYLSEKLEPIRENFERINSKAEWDSVIVKKIFIDERKGKARFFYSDGQLEKVIVRYSDVDHQELIEYYLQNGELSFVYEKEYWYLQYYRLDDFKEKKHKKDKYDIALESTNEIKCYFQNGILIHKWDSQDCCEPFPPFHLLNEEERITDIFNKIIEQKS